LDSTNYDELDMLRRNIVVRYNDAHAKGASIVADTLKAELLEINNRMEANKSLSGLKIYHVSQGENELGEMVMNRGSFYLDTNFSVKDYVQTEDSLLTENE
jgi:hypothetical protein